MQYFSFPSTKCKDLKKLEQFWDSKQWQDMEKQSQVRKPSTEQIRNVISFEDPSPGCPLC